MKKLALFCLLLVSLFFNGPVIQKSHAVSDLAVIGTVLGGTALGWQVLDRMRYGSGGYYGAYGGGYGGHHNVGYYGGGFGGYGGYGMGYGGGYGMYTPAMMPSYGYGGGYGNYYGGYSYPVGYSGSYYRGVCSSYYCGW